MQHHRSWLLRLGARVRELRKTRGWSRRELAKATRISERFLADIETGSGNPSLKRLFELADALGSSPGDLLAGMPAALGTRPILALLGLRGAGKSTVGRRLARAIGWRFVELDARVEERAGMKLDELFAIHGEAHYRRLQREALEQLLAEPEPTVLATGGGIVTDADSFSLLRRRAHTVWLRARPEDHWARVVAQGDTRPMANQAGAYESLCAILSEREALYSQADLTIDTSGREAAAIAAELAGRFRGRG
jgi:XRE family aerobic/anaerobic benzoate catabolism transcriptional regulator